jgi:hypothetical protein
MMGEGLWPEITKYIQDGNGEMNILAGFFFILNFSKK